LTGPAPAGRLVIVGGGPAGLMAARTALAGGLDVTLYEAMPSVGRKFLLAGRGGLNLSHSEPFPAFCGRYREAAAWLRPRLEAFDAGAVVRWCESLGVDTFIGTSGRIFPTDFKAAPLLRAWLHQLKEAGLQVRVRHRLTGLSPDRTLHFDTPHGLESVKPDAVILALGGGSWPHLGSDGAWVGPLRALDVPVTDLRPSNCGFHVAWSAFFADRFAGAPVKSVRACTVDVDGQPVDALGELTVTATGIEGGLVYQLSAPLRHALEAHGAATLRLDLLPGRTVEQVEAALAKPRGRKSFPRHLESALGLKGVKVALLHEVLDRDALTDPVRVAATLKALPITVTATRPLDEAISSAGGIALDALDAGQMIKALPGVFCAGEMLDWEAPTGGYLLTACFATGAAAARGVLTWLARGGDGTALEDAPV